METSGNVAINELDVEDDLVALIVTELGRLGPRVWPLDGVRDEIRALRWQIKAYDHRDTIRQARADLRGIIKTIDKLERQLGNATELLRAYLNPMGWELTAFCEELGRLRRMCASVDARLPTTDEVKFRCAVRAWMMMRPGDRAAKPTNTDNSPFRVIAALLYVAVDPARVTAWRKGGELHDLRDACDAVHQSKREW